MEKAAKQNNSIALFNIALFSQKNKNYKKAIEYYKRAIGNNYGPAYGNLAIMYEKGQGVERDIDKSIELYSLADKNGDYLAKRNLAILYKKLQKYKESEEAFKEVLLAPTYKKNSYEFKQMICLELMNQNNEIKNHSKAYVWGATAVLAGLFDNKFKADEESLKRFNLISEQLTKEEKKFLAKEILLNHYNMFEIYDYYFKEYPELKSSDAVSMANNKHLVHLAVYQVMINEDIVKTINYFKTRDDIEAKINVAIGKLKLASSYIKLGAIVPAFNKAIDNINKAKKVLDKVDYKNLNHLKNNIDTKLLILKDVYAYQLKIHDLKRVKK